MSHEQQQLTVIGWEGRAESRRGGGGGRGLRKMFPLGVHGSQGWAA